MLVFLVILIHIMFSLITALVCQKSTMLISLFSLSCSQCWTDCASESGTCFLNRTQTVRYGVGSSWLYANFSPSSVGCGVGSFGGDPAVNVVKSCQIVLPANPDAWQALQSFLNGE
jgi:hypothetical protein